MLNIKRVTQTVMDTEWLWYLVTLMEHYVQSSIFLRSC